MSKADTSIPIMESFEELGISPELVEALSAEGIEAPTSLQRATIPVLLKGNHLLAQGGPGAGILVAYGVPLLERVDAEATTLQALVFTPTRNRSLDLARSLSRLAQATGHRIASLGAPWAVPQLASILFTTPGELLAALRTSQISVESVHTAVVEGFQALLPADLEALETVLEALPKDGQRVLVSEPLTPAAEAFGKAHLRKAVHLPPKAAQDGEGAPPARGEVAYRICPEDKENDALRTVADLLGRDAEHVMVFFRSDDRAADVGDFLVLHGFRSGAPGDLELPVWLAVDEMEALAATEDLADSNSRVATLSFDTPPDPDALDRRHGKHGPGVILVHARELPHLKEVAKRTGYRLRPAREPIPTSLAAELDRLRDLLRRALNDEDLAPLYLALEPLFDDHSPAEVAAAALAVLRSRELDGPKVLSAEEKSADGPRPGKPKPRAWVRLFVGVGERDGVGPGDLLGAISGEAGLEGSKVGKIEIRDTFSLVEVSPAEADQIIRALNGTTIRGRSARVDYDRGGPKGRSSPLGKGGPRRRIRRDPPQER